MTTKLNNLYGNDNQQHDEIEYTIYCDSLEGQYKQAKKNGMFEILKILELDIEHSDRNLVRAIDYYNEKGGIVEKDAPVDFLTELEIKIVNRDGKFRTDLYCMLLSVRFSDRKSVV